jgi:hypothetical protein
VRALGRQYYEYGRWRRVVMRRHEGSASVRYLAAPVTLVAVAAGTAAAAVGAVTGRPALLAGLLAPAGYAAGLLAGAAFTCRGLPVGSAVRLPAVYATMHGSWAVGFLTSPRHLPAGRPT